MINYDFTGKNVIVTGASMGLGKAIATEFVKAHANVVIADLNEEEANKTSEELSKYGSKVISYKIDVTDYAAQEAMMKSVKEELGSIDVLVNNAGICQLAPLDEMDKTMLDKILNININGTIYGTRAVIPYMKENNNGKIVDMSSIAAKLGGAGCSVYGATKAAVLEFTACMARELAPFNINVNCILPGIIRTPLWEKMLEELTNNDDSKKDEVFKKYTKGIPMGRPQEPVDIARAVLFLCCEEASNITAQNLAVDGGQTY